jgi:hypothetical protein
LRPRNRHCGEREQQNRDSRENSCLHGTRV